MIAEIRQWGGQAGNETWDPGRDMMMVTNPFVGPVPKFMSIWRSPKPIIARVHGWCVGGGSDMALLCDVIVATEDARFGTPYSRVWGCYLTGMWFYRLGLTKTKMLALDHIYPDGILIPDYFIGKNIVHLPTVKTHSYTTTTGAMKNAFGGLLNERRHWTHPVIHETLVDLLMIQKKIHSGVFAVMDGTFAGDGPGPRCMLPHVKNVILASADQVAIDAVAPC